MNLNNLTIKVDMSAAVLSAIKDTLAGRETWELTPEQLRQALDRLGLGATDFAREVGVAPNTVWSWLRGATRIPKSARDTIFVLTLIKSFDP